MEDKKEQSKPSITALSVATAFQRTLAAGYDYLFSPNELALITHITNEGINPIPLLSMNGFFARTLSTIPYTAQTLFFDMAVDYYYDETIMLRKLMIRDQIQHAIQEGATQVVFLSGGYDIRPFISAQEHQNVMFFELDRGVTRETKLKALNTCPFGTLGFKSIVIEKFSDNATQINTNLYYIECDFSTDDLSKTLSKYGFQKDAKSLIIGEGLSMYLNEEENKNILKWSHHLMNNSDSELLLGYSASPTAESSFAVFARGKSDEQYKFHLAPTDAIAYTAACDLDIVAKQDITAMFSALKAEEPITFFKDPNNKRGREWYYLMKKQSEVSDKSKSIESVPDMNISIPVQSKLEGAACLQM